MQRRWRKQVLIAFEIKEEVERVPITFVIEKEVEELEEIVKKRRYKWHMKASTRIQCQIFKLFLIIVGFNNQHF
jgi:hypothetical protein